MRKAKITSHGQDEVPVEEYRPAEGAATGLALVDVLRDSPLRKVKLESLRIRSRVRGVDL